MTDTNDNLSPAVARLVAAITIDAATGEDLIQALTDDEFLEFVAWIHAYTERAQRLAEYITANI